jgi:glycosyltransferase involved in cell wall biosynthesis
MGDEGSMSKFLRKIMMMIACSLLGYGLYAWYTATGGKPSFVIIIPSYNNVTWCEKNIASALDQKYDMMRIVFIDDCSTDGTYEKVVAYVNQYDTCKRCTVIKNVQRRGALANLFYAIHECANEDICVTCDGDDWFAHDHVLERLAVEYGKGNVWLTFGQFITYPEGHYGICRAIEPTVIAQKSYRRAPWVTSHLRSFYAGLFKKIRTQDLQKDGQFFDVTWDMAMMFPMLEMAAGRIAFIPDITYIYNQANPLNDFKNKLEKIMTTERFIRTKPRYAPLETCR